MPTPRRRRPPLWRWPNKRLHALPLHGPPLSGLNHAGLNLAAANLVAQIWLLERWGAPVRVRGACPSRSSDAKSKFALRRALGGRERIMIRTGDAPQQGPDLRRCRLRATSTA